MREFAMPIKIGLVSIARWTMKMAFAEVIGVFVALVFLLVLYVKWAHTYWARKKIPQLECTSFWGNMENPLRQKYGIKQDVKNAHDEFRRRGVRHGGIYLMTRPVYVPVDLELIKNIFSKDFQHFISHGLPYDAEKDPLSAHLFNLDGDDWRNVRVKLTPTFTSGKMKMMFETLLNCGVPMIEHVDRLCVKREPLDIKEILACYTTDVIGSCAFGLECNSFKDPDAEFRKYGRQVFTVSLRNKALDFLRFVLPSLSKIVYVRSVSMDLERFFMRAIRGVMDYRITNGVKRNDFMQLFLDMQKDAKAEGKDSLSFDQIAAQAFVFFLAGFETSSTTVTFCLHELAFNQDIQSKVRDEICDTMKKYDGKLTYDAIMEMKYLDQVINETLRKYPPVPFLTRVCNKDYRIPNTDVTLTAGTDVFISVLGIQKDPEYYPEPERFDPDRFSEENKKKRPAFTFLPFGEGPRICIGLRFGVMQAKVAMCLLLSRFILRPAKGEKYDLEFEPTLIILTKKGNVTLEVIRVNN